MKDKLFCLFLCLFSTLASYSQTKPKNIALVLGSANISTLIDRVDVALDLYRIKKIDKIIVSGGCGAHASSICEATEMKNRLVAAGIPQNIIYKEESSKTTVQNYIFSRVLRDELGQQIIQEKDSLFVVSDHWHAIAVAARFTKYDKVYAKFFIEGDLTPKPTDLLDYSGIFNRYADENEFVLRGTWPAPNAVFSKNEFKNFIFNDRVYLINEKLADTSVKKLTEQFTFLPKDWTTIDAATTDLKNKSSLYFLKQSCVIKGVNGNVTSLSLNKLISALPSEVNYIDACFIKEDELYLFAGNKIIIAKRMGNKFKFIKSDEIKTHINNWPYAWGGGDVAAADYNANDNTIYLYKNGQFAKFDLNSYSVTEVERLVVGWKEVIAR